MCEGLLSSICKRSGVRFMMVVNRCLRGPGNPKAPGRHKKENAAGLMLFLHAMLLKPVQMRLLALK